MRTKSNLADIARMAVSEARRQEITSAVIAGISRGTPLTLVLEAIGCPYRTFADWRVHREDVAEAVGLARDLGYDWIAWDCIRIADDRDGDIIDTPDGPKPNGANVLARKLSVETRLKLLAKWDPRRYGDNKRIEVDAHVEHTTRHVVDSRSLTDEGRAALRRLLAEAQAKGLLPAPVDDPTVIDAIEAEYHEVIDEVGLADDDADVIDDDDLDTEPAGD